MEFVLTLALFALTLFEPALDRAFESMQSGDWAAAASALDEAAAMDPETFALNNLHYLRGRVASNQEDWPKAQSEFEKVERGNPLFVLAVWHKARAAAELGADDDAEALLRQLPPDFP